MKRQALALVSPTGRQMRGNGDRGQSVPCLSRVRETAVTGSGQVNTSMRRILPFRRKVQYRSHSRN